MTNPIPYTKESKRNISEKNTQKPYVAIFGELGVFFHTFT